MSVMGYGCGGVEGGEGRGERAEGELGQGSVFSFIFLYLFLLLFLSLWRAMC